MPEGGPSIKSYPFEKNIAFFLSGLSIDSIDIEEIKEIKNHFHVIMINYAYSKFAPELMDILLWSDIRVSQFLNQYFKKAKVGNNKWWSREKAFFWQKRDPVDIIVETDYWFHEQKEKLAGNYTAVWGLQSLQSFFPEKKILLFGLDMKVEDNKNAKFYDKYTSFDSHYRGPEYPVKDKLIQCADQIKALIKTNNIINCNLESAFDFFKKDKWENYK